MNDDLSTDSSMNKGETTKRLSRRDFINISWKALLGLSSLLGIASLWRFFSFRSASARPVIFDLGPVGELPKNALITVSDAQAVVLSSSDGFKAFSLECPHLGCLVEPREDGFYCPCHGSTFELDGMVTKGPASDPLTELKLRVTDEGHLLLDISETV
jgi:nitrite reductase/ring-hydroxylating ferredoxin subunit